MLTFRISEPEDLRQILRELLESREEGVVYVVSML